MCTFLKSTNKSAYIFTDANIDLLNINHDNYAITYLNIISNNGLLLTNFKASRMYNNSSTLIDHILTSDEQSGMTTGSIIDDLSDHLITFCQPKLKNTKKTKRSSREGWLQSIL
jgi:hypothetical protein